MGRKKIIRPEADRIKSILITKTAIKEMVSEDVVEKVINFQFRDARDATYKHEQIELSGFGKFLISNNKLARKRDRMKELVQSMKKKIEERPQEIKPSRLSVWHLMIKNAENAVEFLNAKKGGYENKHKRDTGGDTELHIREEGDRRDSKAENGDLQRVLIELRSSEEIQ